MKLYTDYPITELGDIPRHEAPIRECMVISYDENKYCIIEVDGIQLEIKRCYIYTKNGRCGDVPCIGHRKLINLIKSNG